MCLCSVWVFEHVGACFRSQLNDIGRGFDLSLHSHPALFNILLPSEEDLTLTIFYNDHTQC